MATMDTTTPLLDEFVDEPGLFDFDLDLDSWAAQVAAAAHSPAAPAAAQMSPAATAPAPEGDSTTAA